MQPHHIIHPSGAHQKKHILYRGGGGGWRDGLENFCTCVSFISHTHAWNQNDVVKYELLRRKKNFFFGGMYSTPMDSILGSIYGETAACGITRAHVKPEILH